MCTDKVVGGRGRMLTLLRIIMVAAPRFSGLPGPSPWTSRLTCEAALPSHHKRSSRIRMMSISRIRMIRSCMIYSGGSPQEIKWADPTTTSNKHKLIERTQKTDTIRAPAPQTMTLASARAWLTTTCSTPHRLPGAIRPAPRGRAKVAAAAVHPPSTGATPSSRSRATSAGSRSSHRTTSSMSKM